MKKIILRILAICMALAVIASMTSCSKKDDGLHLRTEAAEEEEKKETESETEKTDTSDKEDSEGESIDIEEEITVLKPEGKDEAEKETSEDKDIQEEDTDEEKEEEQEPENIFEIAQKLIDESDIKNADRPIEWMFDTAEKGYEVGNTVVLYLDCKYLDTNEVFPGMIEMSNESGSWKLMSSPFSTNLPEEFKNEHEITLKRAVDQLRAMSPDELSLPVGFSEYTATYDSEINVVGGIRCYGIYACSNLGDRMESMGYYNVALDGSGLVDEVRTELFNTTTEDYALMRGINKMDTAYAAVGFIGCYADRLTPDVATEYVIQHLSGISDISETQGDEIYVIIPRFKGTVITVTELPLTDEGTEDGEVLIETSNTLFLRCNASDIFSNTKIKIEYQGEVIEFSPYISLEDGKLVHPDTICDITYY